MGDKSEGRTQAGMSIEPLVYCILGAQVNDRSSILSSLRSVREVQCEFLVLIEDAIRKPKTLKGVQVFQLAIDEAKVGLDFPVTQGTWLMP